MRHPILLSAIVVTAALAYTFGWSGLALVLAAILIGGLSLLAIGLCLIASGAERDAQRGRS